MSSFEIADCPVRLNMAETHSKPGELAGSGAVAQPQRIQKGTLVLTIRNKTAQSRTGRLSVEAKDPTKAEWFSFEGALPTGPRVIERDFKPNGTETFQLNVVVPGNVSPGSHLFNVLVSQSEDDPDNDFVRSPNVGFEVATWTQAPPPREKFPWWAIAVAAVLALVVIGAVTALLWPQPQPEAAADVQLVNGFTGKCLAFADGASPVVAVQFECDKDPARRWVLDKAGDSGYQLKNVKTGKCLTVENGSAGNNARTVQSDCDGQPLRLWKVGDTTKPTQIANVQTGKCATIAGGVSRENNVESVQYDCDQDLSRTWLVKSTAAPATPEPVADAQVQLVNALTEKCLTIAGGTLATNGLHAVQYTCDGDPSRRWTLLKLSDNTYQIKNVKTEKCLTVENDSSENNVPTVQFNCDGQPPRVWKITDISGKTQLSNLKSGKCATIAGGVSRENNVESVQYNCDQDPSRSWVIKTLTLPH